MRTLLSHLRDDARVPITELARRFGMATSTMALRVKEAHRYVARHTALVDFAALGYPIVKRFVVREPDWEALSSHEAVNGLARTYRNDALVEAVFPSMAEAESFKRSLGGHDEYDQLEELARESWR